MPQPFDYTLNIPRPTDTILDALRLGQGMAQIKAAQEKARMDAEANARLQADIAGLGDNPTPEGLSKIMVKYPQLSEQFKRTYDVLDTEQKKAKVGQASQIYAALDAGNTDLAKNLIQTQLDAARNSGDEKSAAAADALMRIVDTNPDAAKTSSGLFLSHALGPDKFTETFAKLQEERRDRQLLPGEIEKNAAELGLTNAQARQTLKNADKLSAETQKLLLEIEAMKEGKIDLDPEKKFKLEQDLRKEYSTETKNFTATQEAFRRIMAAENTAAGDLSLIYSFMKILDPGSTIMEGEFATAQNAAGIPERVMSLYNKALTGERLGDATRQGFKAQAKSLLNASSKREKEVRSGLAGVAKRAGLDVENIFITSQIYMKYSTGAQ